jgi:hypothetical protein
MGPSHIARPGYLQNPDPHVPSGTRHRLTRVFLSFDQIDARRELLVAAAQARKAATAALHNKRVNEQRSSAIRMKTSIEQYTRRTITRRLKVRSRIARPVGFGRFFLPSQNQWLTNPAPT